MRGRGPDPLPRPSRRGPRLFWGLLIGVVIVVALVWFIATYPRSDPQQAPDAVFVPRPANGPGGN